MKDGRLPASGPMTQRDRSQVGFCLPRAYSPRPLGYSPLAFLSSFFYIWLRQVLLAAHGIFSCKLLVAACGIWFSDQGSNLVSLHWECGLLATGPPGSPHIPFFLGPGHPEPFVLWEQLYFRSSLKHLSHLLQVSSSCVCLSYHLESSGHSESVLTDYATPSSTRYTHLPAMQAHLLNILWLDHNPPCYLDTSNILYISHSQKWLYNLLLWTGEHAIGSCVLPLISVE